MGIMSKLALRQLRLNKRRTVMTLIGIVLAVMMITALAGFATSTQGMMKDVFIATNGDYHVAVLNVTDEQAKEILKDPLVESGFVRNETLYNDGGSYEVQGAFVRLAEPSSSYDETAAELAKKHDVKDPAYSYNKELLAMEGYIANDELTIMLYAVIAVLIIVIVIGSIVVISNAFSMSANERMRQFGILKSTGATRRQIMNSVVTEGFYLSIIGIPIGVVAGFALEALALAIANNLMSDLFADLAGASGDIQFHVIFSWPAVGMAALISLATILIAAWRPARRAAKISAIEAIRLSGEIKVSDKKVRTSRLTTKLFGFEGTLAARALKRSRRQYRATVVSLVIGIVLYLVSSGFGASITQALEATYTDYGVNMIASSYTPEKDQTKGLNEKMMELPGGGRAYHAKLWSGYTTLPADMFTADAEQYMANGNLKSFINDMYVNIISVDKEWYAELCKEAGIDIGAQKPGSAIACNFAMTMKEGKSLTYKPLHLGSGDNALSVKGDGRMSSEKNGGTLNISGELDKAEGPLLASLGMGMGDVNFIVSDETYDTLMSDSSDSGADFWFADAKDPQAVNNAWTKVGESETGLRISDISRQAAMTKSLNLLVMIFVYGFIAMLSLIGITSVISAIQTNIGLRAREFAMLSSVGMTPSGRRRMLNLESFFYGAKALLIGIPIGLAISYFMYYMIGERFGFGFVVPWLSIAITCGAVFIIVFATMRYAASRLADMSIIETLRGVE